MELTSHRHVNGKAISLLLACALLPFLPLQTLANKTPLKANALSADKATGTPTIKAAMMPAVCASQQHHAIGKGELYQSGLNVKYVFNEGDLVCLYRGDEHKVYLSCPAKKSVFVSSLADYRRRGLLFTSSGHTACETSSLKDDKKVIEFQKMRAHTYSIYSVAASRSGEIRMIFTGTLTALTKPLDAGVAEFISISYGTPLVPSLPLEMKMRYSAPDASLWFKTHPKDLSEAQNPTGYNRLRTIKLENVKVAGDFFDAPKSFKKVERQEYIINMASATKDFTDLMLP